MRPVCVKCEVEFRMKEAGIYVVETYEQNKSIYKIWCADVWECPICKAEIVSGFANGTAAESHSHDCNAELEKLKEAGRRIIYNKEVKYKREEL